MKAGKTKADFYDYEAYVAKFHDRDNLPKTTDETYTPEDVYNAVVDYVDTIYPLEGKVVVRPFYPGGDYEQYNYPPQRRCHRQPALLYHNENRHVLHGARRAVLPLLLPKYVCLAYSIRRDRHLYRPLHPLRQRC